jgi:uncharacterized protein involved in cysteine biosynthesis
MKEFSNQLWFAFDYISNLLVVVLICSFIPVVNVIAWIIGTIILLSYPFLHFSLYKDYKLKEQEQEEKALIKQYKYQKDLKEAKAFFG